MPEPVAAGADTEEQVVLVDAMDREVGTAGKLRAHQEGALHRAISVFVFDRAGRLLLQRRAAHKYHSAGLWSNTCCSHPRPGEAPLAAARRRLVEELGIDCPLEFAFSFTYRADLGNGLLEHEFDHVFVGRFDRAPTPNADEVADWRWTPVDDVSADLAAHPGRYSAWFGTALAELRRRGLAGRNPRTG